MNYDFEEMGFDLKAALVLDIQSAFEWAKTPEGAEYWSHCHEGLVSKYVYIDRVATMVIKYILKGYGYTTIDENGATVQRSYSEDRKINAIMVAANLRLDHKSANALSGILHAKNCGDTREIQETIQDLIMRNYFKSKAVMEFTDRYL